MGLDSLLLFLALLVLTALFVARPLLAGENENEGAETGELSHWIAERERILEALAELDSDWQLGKVPKEIYKSQRDRLLLKGADALKELEKLGKEQPAKSSTISDRQLEKMIAERKTAHSKGRK